MWEKATELVEGRGSKVLFDSKVVKVEHAEGKAAAVVTDSNGTDNRYECTEVISSMPISALLRAMDPPVPPDVQKAADSLRYRAHITVGLVVPEEFSFPDNWVYINDADVKVGRVQNFGRWSPYLVKDGRTCLGLELFVNEGDEWWTMSDEELIATGTREMDQLGLIDGSKVEVGYVVRTPKAYPVRTGEGSQSMPRLACRPPLFATSSSPPFAEGKSMRNLVGSGITPTRAPVRKSNS